MMKEQLPVINALDHRQHSLKPDMVFGWRPDNVIGAPIPMFYDFESFELP